MQRYFVKYNNQDIEFLESDIHHITNVMRFKVGDEIEIVLEEKAYLVAIDNLHPLKVHIVNPILNDSELPYDFRVYFPLTKSDKAELVVQKLTEIGVSEIIFYRASRSVVKLTNEDFNKKRERYKKIAKEASEQCHRLKVLDISDLINFKDIKDHLASINLLAYEMDAGKTSSLYRELDNINGSISLIVGPEGGLSEDEVSYLTSLNFKRVSLGKRILRCETAAIYGASVISSYIEQK